jgi:hypothetical protein
LVELDRRHRRVTLRVDGERRVELEGALVPVTPRRVWPGRGPRGSGARAVGHFSGTMIPEDMWLAGPPGLESLPSMAPEPAILTPSRTPPPDTGTPGRLWVAAGRRGASILTDGGWRWIPAETVDAVVLRRPAERLRRDDEEVTAPILVSGDGESAEGVILRRGAEGDSVVFARWDGTWTPAEIGLPVDLGNGADATLRVVLDRRSREVAAWLGGREILRARAELGPLRPQWLFVGRMPPPGRSRRLPEGR